MSSMPDRIATNVSDCYLRFARPGDVSLILEFIRGLAAYEKMADEVVATEDLLRENLFGDKAYAEVVLAYYRERPAGFALFFHSFSTFEGKPGIYLEDLFVEPDCRGKGIGTALLRYLARLTLDRNGARLEWSVLNWNQPAIEFYHSLQAQPLQDWTTYRLTGDSLAKAAGT